MNNQTEKKTKMSFLKDRLRSIFIILLVFAGSMVGGALFSSLSQPKEACAQGCVKMFTSPDYRIPTSGSCSTAADVGKMLISKQEDIDRCEAGGNDTVWRLSICTGVGRYISTPRWAWHQIIDCD